MDARGLDPEIHIEGVARIAPFDCLRRTRVDFDHVALAAGEPGLDGVRRSARRGLFTLRIGRHHGE